MSSNLIFHACTKNVELDYHFIRERVSTKEFQIQFLSSKEQIADILTKPLPSHRFLSLRHLLCIHPVPGISLRGGIKR